MLIAIIPAYNEERFIGSVVLKAKKYVDTVMVIDDGSKDLTAEIAQAAGAVVVRHGTQPRQGGGAEFWFPKGARIGGACRGRPRRGWAAPAGGDTHRDGSDPGGAGGYCRGIPVPGTEEQSAICPDPRPPLLQLIHQLVDGNPCYGFAKRIPGILQPSPAANQLRIE